MEAVLVVTAYSVMVLLAGIMIAVLLEIGWRWICSLGEKISKIWKGDWYV